MLLNVVFDDDLYKAGINFIIEYQKGDSSVARVFNNCLSLLAGVLMIPGLVLFALGVKNKLRVLTWLVLFSFSVGVSSFLKLSFG